MLTLYAVCLVFVVLLSLDLVSCGDDASVHVHVESSPGQLMAPTVLTAADFSYENHALRNPGIVLNGPGSRWQGDEMHSQGGADAASMMQRPFRPMSVRSQQQNSAEQRIQSGPRASFRRSAPAIEHDYPGLGMPYDRSLAQEPRYRQANPSSFGRTHFDYDIPFPSTRKADVSPRHQHGGSIDTIPTWLARKKLLSRYGLKKYLQPFGQMNVDELERMDPFDQHAAPVYSRASSRMTAADVAPLYYNAEGDDY